jgi:hypothetical protein
MIKVNAHEPNAQSYGNPYFADISTEKGLSTIFDFDIPAWWAGKTCSLIFLFPTQDQLPTSSYTFKETWGTAKFTELEVPATQNTTFNSVGAVAKEFGEFNIAPGNGYVLGTHACPAGERVGIEMSGVEKNGYGFDLSYFQDYNLPPIGLYVRAC